LCSAQNFTVCPGSNSDLVFNDLIVSPAQPVIGQPVSVAASGTIDETVTSGQVVMGVILFGINIYTQTDDWAQYTPMPVGPGPIDIKYSISIPGIAPPGTYTISLTFNDQNNNAVGCIQIPVTLIQQ